MRLWRRPKGVVVLAFLLSALSCHRLGRFFEYDQSASALLQPKYIFIFLADGAGITHLEITRLFSQHIYKERLNVSDRIIKDGRLGLLTTHSADSLVTYSAEAATALANGCKAKINAIGICTDGTVPKTVLEVAKGKGMRIGLITTAEIYDATPAAFATHVPNRRLSAAICDQYLTLEPDVLLGGGRDQFLAQNHAGSGRNDDRDLITLFKNKGYAYVSNKEELMNVRGSKILGLFSLRDLSFEIDKNKEVEPSIVDMTQAALRLLQNDPKNGFVLFIESEHIDTAGHFSDVAALIHDFREFDRAVGLAYEFYQKHPHETLLLVTSDHETGGLGLTTSSVTLPNGLQALVNPSLEDLKKIASIRISVRKAAELLDPNPSVEAVKKLVAENFTGFTLPPEVIQAIVEKKVPGPTLSLNTTAAALGAMVAHNTHAYWSTSGHTNQPVFVAALGVGADRFAGYQDNTDFAKHLFALIGGAPSDRDSR